MKFTPKFYRCEICGQIIGVVENAGERMTCCGKNMTYLKPNSSEGAGEKHVPTVEINGSELTVKVGSVPHPMTEEHHIEWIYLFLENGGQRRILSHTGTPEATFNIEHGKPFAVFEYCNLHGLWTAEIEL